MSLRERHTASQSLEANIGQRATIQAFSRNIEYLGASRQPSLMRTSGRIVASEASFASMATLMRAPATCAHGSRQARRRFDTSTMGA